MICRTRSRCYNSLLRLHGRGPINFGQASSREGCGDYLVFRYHCKIAEDEVIHSGQGIIATITPELKQGWRSESLGCEQSDAMSGGGVSRTLICHQFIFSLLLCLHRLPSGSGSQHPDRRQVVLIRKSGGFIRVPRSGFSNSIPAARSQAIKRKSDKLEMIQEHIRNHSKIRVEVVDIHKR